MSVTPGADHAGPPQPAPPEASSPTVLATPNATTMVDLSSSLLPPFGGSPPSPPPTAGPLVEHTRYLTVELIAKLLKGQALEEATVLRVTLPGKGEKIARIESLEKVPNLEHLSLRHQKIAKIENLQRLVRLKELQLAHNQIPKLENLSSLFRLEVLDVSHNKVLRIPPSLGELKRLRALLLNDNQLGTLQDVVNLRECCNLTSLDLRRNPIAALESYRSYTVFQLPQLQMLDGVPITDAERAEASARWNRRELWECEGQLKAVQAEVQRLEQVGTAKDEALAALERKHQQLRLAHQVDRARLAELEPRLERSEAALSAKTLDLIRAVDDLYTLRHQFELLKVELGFLVDLRYDDEPPTPSMSRLDRTELPRFHDPQLATLVMETVQQVQEVRNVLLAQSHNVSHADNPAPAGKGRTTPAVHQTRGVTPSRFTLLTEDPQTAHADQSFTRYSALFETSAIAGDVSFDGKARGSRSLSQPPRTELQDDVAALLAEQKELQEAVADLHRQERSLCTRCSAGHASVERRAGRSRSASAPPGPRTPSRVLVLDLTSQVEELRTQNSLLVESMQELRAEEERRMADLQQLHGQVAGYLEGGGTGGGASAVGPIAPLEDPAAALHTELQTLADRLHQAQAEEERVRHAVDALRLQEADLRQRTGALAQAIVHQEGLLQVVEGQQGDAERQLKLLTAEQISREQVHQQEVDALLQRRGEVLAGLTERLVEQRRALEREAEALAEQRMAWLQQREESVLVVPSVETPTSVPSSAQELCGPTFTPELPFPPSLRDRADVSAASEPAGWLRASGEALQQLHATLAAEIRAMLGSYSDLLFDNDGLAIKCSEQEAQLAALRQEVQLLSEQKAGLQSEEELLLQRVHQLRAEVDHSGAASSEVASACSATPSRISIDGRKPVEAAGPDWEGSRREHEQLQARCRALREALERQQEQWALLRDQEEARESASRQRRRDLIEEEGYLQSRCEALRGQLQALVTEHAALKDQLAAVASSGTLVDPTTAAGVGEELGVACLRELQGVGLALLRQEQQIRLRLRLLYAELGGCGGEPASPPTKAEGAHGAALLEETRRLGEVLVEVTRAVQQATAEEDRLKTMVANKRATYEQICGHIAQLQAAHHQLVAAYAAARQFTEDPSIDSTPCPDAPLSVATPKQTDAELAVLKGEEAQLAARVRYLQTLERSAEQAVQSLKYEEERLRVSILRLEEALETHKRQASSSPSPSRPPEGRAPGYGSETDAHSSGYSAGPDADSGALDGAPPLAAAPSGPDPQQQEALDQLAVLHTEVAARQRWLAEWDERQVEAEARLAALAAEAQRREGEVEEFRREQQTLLQLIDTLRQQWSEKQVQVQRTAAELEAAEERLEAVGAKLYEEAQLLVDTQERRRQAEADIERLVVEDSRQHAAVQEQLTALTQQLEVQQQRLDQGQAEQRALEDLLAARRLDLTAAPRSPARRPLGLLADVATQTAAEGGEALREAVPALQAELAAQQRRLLEVRREQLEAQRQVQALLEEQSAAASHVQAETRQRQRLEEAVEAQREQQERLRQECDGLQTRRDRLLAQVEELEARRTHAETHLGGAGRAAEERADLARRRAADAEERLAALHAEADAAQGRLSRAQEEEQRCLRRLHEAYETHDWLEAEMTVARTRLSAIRSTASVDSSVPLDPLAQELESQRAHHMEALERRMTNRMTEMTFLDAITRRVADLRLEEQQLRQNVDALRQTKSLLASEVAELEHAARQRGTDLQQLREERLQAERRLRHLQRQAEGMAAKLEEDQLSRGTTPVGSAASSAKKPLQRMAQELHALKAERRVLASEVEALKEQKRHLQQAPTGHTPRKERERRHSQPPAASKAAVDDPAVQLHLTQLNQSLAELSGQLPPKDTPGPRVQRLQVLWSMEQAARAFVTSLQREEERLLGAAGEPRLEPGASGPAAGGEESAAQLELRVQDLRVLEESLLLRLEALRGPREADPTAVAADLLEDKPCPVHGHGTSAPSPATAKASRPSLGSPQSRPEPVARLFERPDSIVPVPPQSPSPTGREEGESLRSPGLRYSPPGDHPPAPAAPAAAVATTRVQVEVERRPRGSSHRRHRRPASPHTLAGTPTPAPGEGPAPARAGSVLESSATPPTGATGSGAPQRPVEAFGPPAALPASALVHSALSGGASTGSAGGHKTYHRHYHYIHDHTGHSSHVPA